MRTKISLDQISLVCVETRQFGLAHFALEKCMEHASFKEVLLLSSSPAPFNAGIKNVLIPSITSTKEYSEFIICKLGDYFNAEFVLIVQWDSFILHPEIWRSEFLQYDYIGAPWPHRTHAVGNGGFSLRSRRLVNALKNIEMSQFHPEDQCICEFHREELESEYGICFAPPDIASEFAFELSIPQYRTFGFHGFFNFHKALTEAEILQYISICGANILQSLPARRLIKNLYKARMFEAANQLIRMRLGSTTCWRSRLDSIKLLIKSLSHQFLKGEKPSRS